LIAWLSRPGVVRAFQLLFFVAAIAAVYYALEPHARDPLGDMRDKFKHIIAFATLSGLGAFAFPRMPLPRLGERLSFLGALIEVFQSIPALHRDCDPKDWIADTLAIILVLGAVHLSGLRRAEQI
jgi:hypothetical protein